MASGSKMGIRPRSPSPCSGLCAEAQGGGPSSPKRPRLDQPGPVASPEAEPEGPRSPGEGPAEAEAQSGFTCLVSLAPGCALKLPLSHADVRLEPRPAALLTVNLPHQTLFLVPDDLVVRLDPHAAQRGDRARGLLLKVRRDAVWEDISIREEVCCEAGPELPVPEDARGAPDSHPDFMEISWSRPQRGPVELSAPADGGHAEAIEIMEDFRLSGSVPDSPLQPLPRFPSPTCSPQLSPRRPRDLPCRSRRRLFPDA
ncbi:proline-rich protein 23A-like [Perognathus longimembris pacificus]|uniref:proline-rich protein 23A-like n=1 Tax=Perognathus longimembris pacificus TaxID=214514 RepID=UPI002018FC0F|nr:proline-rich protein 23A-like [Perognathus longimembris pacificus]